MNKTYNDNIKELLKMSSDITMKRLGEAFAHRLLDRIKLNNSTISLACTVEDADYLAKGIIDILKQNDVSVTLSCFWNQQFSPYDMDNLTISPIIRKYQEPIKSEIDYLIMVQSIITDVHVIKTNLMNLIETIKPKQIIFFTPIIHSKAKETLLSYDQIDLIYFTQDDKTISNSSNFKCETPKLIKERRSS